MSEPKPFGALSSIGANYSSSSDEEEEDPPKPFQVPSTFEDIVSSSIPVTDNNIPLVPVPPPASSSFASFRGKDDESSEDSDSDSSSSEDKGPRKPSRRAKDDGDEADTDGDPSTDEELYDSSLSAQRREDKAKKKELPKVKGEMSYDDLPPIQDLHISVPHEKAAPIGIIKSVVDPLVIVEALPGTPALDIESVLFLDQGDRVLGQVFDVMGPVRQPWYSVRFNSKEHIQERRIEPGMQVYCAPSTPHASFVLIAQLQKMRGTDASWKDDCEAPPNEQDFSDDEKERQSKRNRKQRQRQHRFQNQHNPEGAPMIGPQLPFQNPNPTYGNHPETQRQTHYRNKLNFYTAPRHPTTSYYGYCVPPPPPPPPPKQEVTQQPSWHTHPSVSSNLLPNPFRSDKKTGIQTQEFHYVPPTPPPWPHPYVQQQNM